MTFAALLMSHFRPSADLDLGRGYPRPQLVRETWMPLNEGPLQQVVVRAYDDPGDLAKPRGKQDWQLEPHSIWYPRTTGIWQTVWIERVPATWIRTLRWTP